MTFDFKGPIKVINDVWFSAPIVWRGPLVDNATTNEDGPPWRHGRGKLLRLWPSLRHPLTKHRAVAIGRWWPTSEEVPGYLEGEVPLSDQEGGFIPTTEAVKAWPGSAVGIDA